MTKRQTIMACIALLLAFYAGYSLWAYRTDAVSIDSFQECATRYQVLTTYPEQCKTPDGQIFVNKVQ